MSTLCHIAVFAFPFGSHATPVLNLVKRLAASMSEDVMLSFLSTAESNRSIFSSAEGDEFQKIKAYNVWDGVPDGHLFSGDVIFEESIDLFINATPDNFEKAMKEAEDETGVKISCILADAFLWFACDLAEKIGVPWIPFWTSASFSLSTHLYTDDIRRVSATTEQILSFIPGLETIDINDVPREVSVEQSPLSTMLYNMALKLPRASAVVINSFEEMDPAITIDLKSKFQKLLNVGPLTLVPPSKSSNSAHKDDCILWLEKQEYGSVVYISFGSSTTPPPEEMMALAEALETLMVPFMWSLRDHARKNLPAGFIDRSSKYGKFVSWAPQVEVLASGKVGVFVTHGGWNSILESSSYGVPLICRPLFGDHKLNSAMAEDKWKIGLPVKDGVFTKSATINALELILFNDEGKEIKKNAQVLKEKTMDAVKPNGSSSRNLHDLLEIVTKA